jgi:hypothetical protein
MPQRAYRGTPVRLTPSWSVEPQSVMLRMVSPDPCLAPDGMGRIVAAADRSRGPSSAAGSSVRC